MMIRAKVAEIITYNAAIITCGEPEWQLALGLLSTMGKQTFQLQCGYQCIRKRQEWQLALGSLSTIISAKWMRTRSVTMRPSAHAKRQEWQLALALLRTMIKAMVESLLEETWRVCWKKLWGVGRTKLS